MRRRPDEPRRRLSLRALRLLALELEEAALADEAEERLSLHLDNERRHRSAA